MERKTKRSDLEFAARLDDLAMIRDFHRDAKELGMFNGISDDVAMLVCAKICLSRDETEYLRDLFDDLEEELSRIVKLLKDVKRNGA